MEYKTIKQIRNETEHKRILEKVKYKPSLNKRLFWWSLVIAVVGFGNPLIPSLLGCAGLFYSFIGVSIDYDKYLIKLRRLRYRF